MPIYNPVNSVFIGNKVLSGTANSVLYIDSNGKLAQSTKLVWNGTTLTVTGGGSFSDEVTIDNGAADGAGTIFASLGFSNWQIDNSSGVMRFFQPGLVHMSLATTGLTLLNALAVGGTITLGTVDQYLKATNTSAQHPTIFGLNSNNDLHFLANVGDTNNLINAVYFGFNAPMAFAFGQDCCGGAGPTSFTFTASTASIFQNNVLGVYTEIMRVNVAGVRIGGTAVRSTTTGTNQLIIFNGTAAAGTLANGISMFSVSGKLKSADAAGTVGHVVSASAVNTVSPTSPNRTLTVDINGTTYYIAAKTTND